MAKPEPGSSVEQQAAEAARSLGRQVLGRELGAEEAAAMTAIFQAAVQALRHGFIRRLAEQVQAERETETVEEFFEDIRPD